MTFTIHSESFVHNLYHHLECTHFSISNSERKKDAFLPSELQHNRISLTYPATERHIEKARAAEQEFFIETPEIYNKITKSYIDEQKNFLQWVRLY